jgi:predicted TIM-barrel fold metal-dependent hydrolase
MITRRRFLGSTLGAGALLATQGCQQMPPQSSASGKRMIVDAQVHLWTAPRPDWPWVPGMKPQMPEPFTIEKLVPMMDEAGVDRVVVVPPSWPGDRNDYGLEAARRYPTRFGVMGRIPLRNPKSAALLPTWRDQPGMLGVRVTFLGKDIEMLSDGSADWFWPAAEKAGLPVMFLATERGPVFARIAERHPGLQLIVDHMGLSLSVQAVREGKFAASIEHTLMLAKYPNVSVKLSAAPNYSLETYPFRDMTPHIRRVFDAFGPRRCYWGSDMTNGFDKATYRQRITHFTGTLDFLTEDDKDWVMGRGILARLRWA